MGFSQQLTRLRPLPLMRRRAVRWRLTCLYGGLFLAAGAGLLAITYLLVAAFPGKYTTQGPSMGRPGHGPHPAGTSFLSPPASAQAQAAQQHAADMHQFLVQSGISLAIMAVAAIGLGWLIAGRILRPLQIMTATTRRISADSLHHRLALQGPPDELKALADTIDGLLDRLDAAFDAQRRFAANASHELRTPLTLERAMLEVALANPRTTLASLRSTCEEVLAACQDQERLIEALLILARSQQGLDHRRPFDLAEITTQVLDAHRPQARARQLIIETALAPATVHGDARLAARLVTNLADNAIRYNNPGGRVEIVTAIKAGRPALLVANTGPPVPDSQIERLLRPFQRLATGRTGQPDGHGLGLSIAQAIAAAHDATLTASPRPGGGLAVEVTFPPSAAPEGSRPG
jgi:signal transduction histidine kinase